MENRNTQTPNEIINCGDYYEIVLYNNKSEEIARAKINKDNLVKVKQYKWYLSYGYARTVKDKKTLKLHQLILGKKEGFDVDHINHDILDNRKQNLRHCTRSQNQMNQKCKGYFWHKRDKRWVAKITINQKTINLGSFKNEKDAIKVRRKAELKYFKEFAYPLEVGNGEVDKWWWVAPYRTRFKGL